MYFLNALLYFVDRMKRHKVSSVKKPQLFTGLKMDQLESIRLTMAHYSAINTRLLLAVNWCPRSHSRRGVISLRQSVIVRQHDGQSEI